MRWRLLRFPRRGGRDRVGGEESGELETMDACVVICIRRRVALMNQRDEPHMKGESIHPAAKLLEQIVCSNRSSR